MSQSQLNSTTNRVMTKTNNACLQNFQLINGLTTIVNSNAQISDLLLADNSSDIQTLLASSKTIMDYAIARGLASMDISGSIVFNYNQQYSNTPSTTTSLTIYQNDLSYFYKYDALATNDYTPKTNNDLYSSGAVTNADFIAGVNTVISQYQQCISLITDISSTL